MKRIKAKVFIIAILVLSSIILYLNTKHNLISDKQDKKIYLDLKDTKKIEIYNNISQEKEYKPILISDKHLIDEILNYLNNVEDYDEKDKNMSEITSKSQSINFYNSGGEQKIINYSYNSTHNVGKIEYNNEKFNVPHDFFRLISSLEEFRPQYSKVPNDVKELFKKYNWTPSFLIASQQKTIPNNFKHSSDDTVEKIYWAYNIELSKDIGLDFSNLKSKEITAEVYNLTEPLSDGLKDTLLSTRGIIIRYEGKIVGSYIDSGRHEGNAISLKRHSFKDVEKEDLNTWVEDNCIDKSNPLYIEVSKLSNEDLIKMYIKAIKENNTKVLLTTMDVESKISTLFINLDNHKLFNDTKFEMNLPDYIDNDKIVYMEKMDLKENDKRCYNVIFGGNDIMSDTGRGTFSDINIDVVNEKGVWKVSGFTK
ncbi:DUF4830 domain-containing protein [Clostridioides difficile]|nr:DUF4830 domain-containing protein [Clostridioides difficile]